MGHWGCKMLPPYLYIIDLRIQTPPQKKCDGSKSISPKYKIDPILRTFLDFWMGKLSHLDSAKQPFIGIHQIVALRIDDAQRHRDGKPKWKPWTFWFFRVLSDLFGGFICDVLRG